MDHWRFLISATDADDHDASPAPELDLDLPEELSDPRFRFPSASDVAAIEAAQDEVIGALVELCRSHDQDPALDADRAPLTLSIAGWHNPSGSGSLGAALLQSLTDAQGVYEEFGMPLPVELHSSDPDAHERSRLAALHLSRVRLSDIEKQQVRAHAALWPLSAALCACLRVLPFATLLTSLPLLLLFLLRVHTRCSCCGPAGGAQRVAASAPLSKFTSTRDQETELS